MPVPPEQLDAIAATTAALYREAETALVEIITRHLQGDLDGDMQSPAWAERKLAAVRSLRKATWAVIAGLQASGEGAVREAAAEAFRAGRRSALAELPEQWFPASGIAAEVDTALAQVPGWAAIEATAAAVHQDIGERSRNILRDTVDVYRDVITGTVARTLTGTQTRRQAAQAAWAALRKRGISGFTDRAGRRWQLASYVEMATRTVTQRAAVAGQTARLRESGVQLVYVSNAAQECELCRPLEGRVLRLDDGPTGEIQVPHQLTNKPITVDVDATLAQAQAQGLFHPNCRHSVSAYLPGVTKLPVQPTADPEGDKARQEQRAIERAIRKAKTDQVAALDGPEGKRAGAKVRALQARMREHLAEHPDLKRLSYREQIGAGNIPTATNRDDTAGAIGAPMQRTIDGALDRPRGNELAKPEQVDPTDPDPDQLTLDDATPKPVDVTSLDDQALDAAYAEALDSGDEDLLDAVLAEMDRRTPAVVEPAAESTWVDDLFAPQPPDGDDEQVDDGDIENAEQWARFDELVAAGVDEREAYAEAFDKDPDKVRREEAIVRLRDDGHRGRGFDELARAAFRAQLEQDIIVAEHATNGQLLNAEGRGRGLDPRDLWQRNESYARRWASDELKEWWDTHGRITYDAYSEALLSGGAADRFRTDGETWLR